MSKKHDDISKLSEPFRALIGNQGLNYQILDLLPVPLEIFTPDGTCIFMNRAHMEMVGITDASLLVGKYNLKNDPVCLGIIGSELMDRIFRGEAVSFPNFPAPIQDVLDRGAIAEKPWEAATMDIFNLPIWDGDKFVCTISFFTVKNAYKGRADVIKAQEYIETHWQDEFDIDKIAHSVYLGKRQFQRIFKEVTGNTPVEFYQQIKIDKLKEKLLDGNLTIEQAFLDCGADTHGRFARLFKDSTGMTPTEYRKKMMK